MDLEQLEDFFAEIATIFRDFENEIAKTEKKTFFFIFIDDFWISHAKLKKTKLTYILFQMKSLTNWDEWDWS